MKKILMSLVTIFGVVVMVAGSTQAVFSDTENINGNTITTAVVDIDLRSLVNKPINVSGLLPGQWTLEGKVDVYNLSNSSPVKVYMYASDVTGEACDKIKLHVETGHAPAGTGNVRYSGDLLGIDSEAEKVLLTAAPPFNVLNPNTTQVVTQKAQLDSDADNTYQNKSCTWNEVFVAEGVTP